MPLRVSKVYLDLGQPASPLQGHEISNLRIFLEDIAQEKGFDPRDFHSWESIGNAEIEKRVCIGFILLRLLWQLSLLNKCLQGGSYMLQRRGGLATVIKQAFPEAVFAQWRNSNCVNTNKWKNCGRINILRFSQRQVGLSSSGWNNFRLEVSNLCLLFQHRKILAWVRRETHATVETFPT